MTLWRYIFRGFIQAFLGVFVVLALVIWLFIGVDINRKLAESDATFRDVVDLTLMQSASILYQILPLVVLLASLVTFLRLARSSELVVIRASGISALKLIMVPIIGAIIIGMMTVSALNPFLALTNARSEQLKNRFTGSDQSSLSFSNDGVWMRQADQKGQTVIQAARTNSDGTVLSHVVMHRFDANDMLFERVDAPEARLRPGRWVMDSASTWERTGTDDFRPILRAQPLEIATDLTTQQILESFAPPELISIWKLRGYIVQLENAGFSGLRHRLHLQSELAKPLLFAAMVLIGAIFALRPARRGQTGIMILLAVLAGFSLYFIRDFAETLGAQNRLPLAVAVWVPPIAAIFMALGLLLHLEDG